MFKNILVLALLVLMSSCSISSDVKNLEILSQEMGCLKMAHHFLDSPTLNPDNWKKAVVFCEGLQSP